MKGIDVSILQGNINWRKAKADGVKFAMVKATQGRGESAATKHLRVFTDGKLAANVAGAHNAGIDCGVYHYFTAKTDAEAEYEAEYFVEAIKPYKQYIDLWAAVDVESEPYLGKVGKTMLTSATKTFMDYVKKQGFKPMLYTNPNYLKYRFTPNAFKYDDIWLAHWGVKKPMSVPNTQMWQYGLGRVNGINADVDMDEGFFDDGQCQDSTKPEPSQYKVGDKYTVRKGDKYINGKSADGVAGNTYTITRVMPGQILVQPINSWIKI